MSKRLRPKRRRNDRRQRADVELKPLRRELDALVRSGKAEQAVEVAWSFINELCGTPPAGPARQSSERIKPGVLQQTLDELESGGALEEVDAIEVDDDRAFVDPILENQRVALYRFTKDVRIPLDNTEVERRIRIVALDRNNSLFAGSRDGAAGRR